MTKQKLLITIFNTLLEQYGPRKWWPARSPFEVIVGAILTQNVSWKNAKIAVLNLKQGNLLSPEAILSANHAEISSRIKSSRFYNQKTDKLKLFCSYLVSNYSGSLNKMFSNKTANLRRELLNIKGIGEETADSILLYAGNKLSFVIDAYTKRFLARLGYFDGLSTYDEIRSFFMNNLPNDVYIYNEYHALIVHHSYLICKFNPGCDVCPLKRNIGGIECRFLIKTSKQYG